ncbi:MAG: hypothetical protein K2K81_07275 [Muribaculaceae bacterium]|nr:hypothetical protein [Muribaculaceae bacterium]
MERDSFIFYKSFYEAIRDLPDNIRLEVFTAITEYALYGKQPEDLKPFARGMFTLVKPNLDANISRFENGKKGGRKPKKKMAEAKDETSTPLKSPPPYASFEDEVALIKSDVIWLEPVCMQFKIEKGECQERLDAFITHCKVERGDKLHPSLNDAKRHFTSWMRKAYAGAERKNSEPSKPDDYTYNGGFGGLD